MSCLLLSFLTPILEDVVDMVGTEYDSFTLWCLFGSAGLAFLVNLSIFLVIRYTSPLSYNILGHMKLATILISGFVLFGEAVDLSRMLGAALTCAGVVAYTHVKMQAARVEKVVTA